MCIPQEARSTLLHRTVAVVQLRRSASRAGPAGAGDSLDRPGKPNREGWSAAEARVAEPVGRKMSGEQWQHDCTDCHNQPGIWEIGDEPGSYICDDCMQARWDSRAV